MSQCAKVKSYFQQTVILDYVKIVPQSGLNFAKFHAKFPLSAAIRQKGRRLQDCDGRALPKSKIFLYDKGGGA